MPEFTDARGVAIVYDVHPAEQPRAVVMLLHGVGEHAGRYGAVIAALTAAGYTVYADDHRGHGRTGLRQWNEDATRLGHLGPGGHRAAEDAVWQFTQLIRDENPDLPLVMLGHSWGSFLAQILLNRHPDAYDAVVLTGSGLRVPGGLNAGDLNRPWRKTDSTGMAWLSSDPAVPADFVADPLTVTTPLMRLFGLVESVRMMGLPRRGLPRDVPLLLMVGREDTVGGPRSVHRLADAYRTRSGLGDITTLVYPRMRHEIFNEIGSAEVFADLLAWLDRRFPARS